MTTKLKLKPNILRLNGTDIVCINSLELETFTIWESRDEPNENDEIAAKELLQLDNEVLLEAIQDSSNIHYDSLLGLAATLMLPDEVEVINEEDDDDSSRHCSLNNEKKCKYMENAFKPPTRTMWIGSTTPSCNRWFHESCLSLKQKKQENHIHLFVKSPRRKRTLGKKTGSPAVR